LGESPKLGGDVFEIRSCPVRQAGHCGKWRSTTAAAGTVGCACNRASRQFQQGLAVPVGEKSEIADAQEALGQYVQEEALQKLTRRKYHLPLLVAVGVVPPEEHDIAVGDLQEAVIGGSARWV
jgi:hypothetical protein